MLSPHLLLFIIAAHFVLLVVIAHWTSIASKNSSFFLADRNAPWWLVAIGAVGATISGITFVSVPGAVGAAGPNTEFSYMQFIFGTMAGYYITAFVLLPVYYRMNLVSIYGYLEERFGVTAQKTGAVFFMIARIVGSSMRLYLLALALQKFVLDPLGVPFWLTATLIPFLIWSYTFRGGTKTILITDALQTVLFVAAVALTLRDLAAQLGTSYAGLFASIEHSPYSHLFFFREGWSDPNNFFKQFLAGALMTTCTTGLDQDLMQKNLACRNLHQCRKNILASSVSMLAVNYLFLLLGRGTLSVRHRAAHHRASAIGRALSDASVRISVTLHRHRLHDGLGRDHLLHFRFGLDQSDDFVLRRHSRIRATKRRDARDDATPVAADRSFGFHFDFRGNDLRLQRPWQRGRSQYAVSGARIHLRAHSRAVRLRLCEQAAGCGSLHRRSRRCRGGADVVDRLPHRGMVLGLAAWLLAPRAKWPADVRWIMGDPRTRLDGRGSRGIIHWRSHAPPKGPSCTDWSSLFAWERY